MRIAVVGLGYVGLPLVIEAINCGHQVIGIDVNAQVVKNLNSGISHVDDIENAAIIDALKLGFQATVSYEKVAESDVVVICVPTPLSAEGGPDLQFVEAAGHAIGKYLIANTLVSLESTSYPGTTEEILKPILELKSKLIAGKDYYLVFSPERIDPGNKVFGFRNTPKIVGGINESSLQVGIDFYSTIVDQVVPASGLKEAEMSKLLENTYRHINIALLNEMAKFCHELEIDIWDVIKNASTKPFGFEAFYPGPGVGGHCIPIDPNYLSHKVQAELGYPFKFVQLAEEINNSMPAYIVERIIEILKNKSIEISNAKLLLVGVSYKKNIGDTRETPAKPIALQLIESGAEVIYWDPFVSDWNVDGQKLKSSRDLKKLAEETDLIVILQDHSELKQFDLSKWREKIFSTRGNINIESEYSL